MRPTLSGLFLRPRRFGTAGTTLHFTLDDRATLDAEIWHLASGRRRGYAGWERWRGHIGFNQVRFAIRGPHFKPAPGRYVALLRATDFYNNVSRTKRLSFTISPARRRRHHPARAMR